MNLAPGDFVFIVRNEGRTVLPINFIDDVLFETEQGPVGLLEPFRGTND